MKKIWVTVLAATICSGIWEMAPQVSASGEIREFSLIYQEPELPTGCEVTALTMVLNYYGYDVDKVTMATEYLPCLPAEFFYGENGIVYGNDMVNYFVGDPTTEAGYICGAPAIVTAANSYLISCGSSLRAVDGTGEDPEKLYDLASEGTPVIFWGPIGMEERQETSGWYTYDGDYMEWSTNDHGLVLVNYQEDMVVIADSIVGWLRIPAEWFEEIYQERGCQCVIIQ